MEYLMTEEVGSQRDPEELVREHTRTVHSVTSEGKLETSKSWRMRVQTDGKGG